MKTPSGANLKARAFLAAFRVCASITQAAEAVGIRRDLHYRWLKDSKGYTDAFEAAREQAGQSLEDEAVLRATKGVFEPNVWKGEFCFEQVFSEELQRFVNGKQLGVWKKSDALLVTLLKGARPDKYRERGLFEVTGKGGGAVSIEIVERLKAARQRTAPAPE